MPFLNSRGDVAHGVGGGYCNVNNQRVAFGGVLGWWDDDTVAFFNGDNNWLASLYHVPTKTIEVIDERYGGPAGGVSGNQGYCSGANAASWWLGSNDPAVVGLWSTVGLRKPLAGLMGMGPDNAIAYKPDYQSMGPTMYRRPDGTEWEITPGSTEAPCLLGADRILWMEGLTPHVLNLPPIKTAPGHEWMGTAAFAAGQWWYCCYNGDRGVILHSFAFPDKLGYSVLPQGNAWVTMRALTATTVRVCWADHIEEQAGQIHARDYDVSMGIVRDPYAADPEWQTTQLVDITKINYVPPAVGTASFTLNTVSGAAPLTVTATLTQENLTTWRWLLDGVIDQPIDGLTHTFTIQTEGVHTIGLRAQAPAGPVTVPAQTVVATQQSYIPGSKAVQVGFGTPHVNAQLNVYKDLSSRKWDMSRITACKDAALNQVMVDEVTSQGQRPYVISKAPMTELPLLPEWIDVEILNEPDIEDKLTPAQYIKVVLDALPLALARHQRVWAGCVSNTSKGNLDWLRQVVAGLPPEVNISIHRYPQEAWSVPQEPRKDYATRADEMAAIKAIIGTRTWGVSECGYSQAPYTKPKTLWEWIKSLFGWKAPEYALDDATFARFVKEEFAIWFAAGASFVTWYQVWEDATEDCGLAHQDWTWKPAADVWL